jgi:DNA-directed RNA polymerase specialized sigma24 family protein
MYAWGRLKDKYARLFAHNARTQDESVYLRQVRAGKHHYIQEEHIPPRGSYGRTALFAPTPNDRIAPGSQDDARIDILEAVKSLTPLQQTVFTACVINGRLQTDVAAERGITRYAVLRILQRAKAKLRQLLGDYDE